MSARSNFQLTFSISSRNQRACGGLFVGRRPTFFLLSPTLFLSRHVFAASPHPHGPRAAFHYQHLVRIFPLLRRQRNFVCRNQRDVKTHSNGAVGRKEIPSWRELAQANSTEVHTRALFNYLFCAPAREMLPGGSRHIRRECPLTWKFTRNKHTDGDKNCPRPFTFPQFAFNTCISSCKK